MAFCWGIAVGFWLNGVRGKGGREFSSDLDLFMGLEFSRGEGGKGSSPENFLFLGLGSC